MQLNRCRYGSVAEGSAHRLQRRGHRAYHEHPGVFECLILEDNCWRGDVLGVIFSLIVEGVSPRLASFDVICS